MDGTNPEELLIEIREAEAACATAEYEVIRLKDELKEAKEFYGLKVARLRQVIRAVENDGDRPLFAGAAEAACDVAVEVAGDGEPTNAQAADDGITAANWRDQPLSKLLLTEKMIDKLNEASLISLGQLADFTRAGKQLTDVHGIGEAAAGKILQALENFWHLHPDV